MQRLTKIQALKTNKFKIEELLNKTISLFNEEIQLNKIDVNLSVNPKDLIFEADIKLLEQVLINLLKNAIESTINCNSGKIKICANFNSDSRIEIRVTDTGSGISDENTDKIFMPFFTTKEQGSGIGLSLARQIMRLHGGSISVQSIPNIKTTFILSF